MFCYFAAAVRTYTVTIESLRRFVICLFIYLLIYLFKTRTIQAHKSMFKKCDQSMYAYWTLWTVCGEHQLSIIQLLLQVNLIKTG